MQPPERWRSEEHTSELQSRQYLVCRLLLEKKNTPINTYPRSRRRHHAGTCARQQRGARTVGGGRWTLVGVCGASVRARCFFFFFNDTATTEIYTLSLHDALPISTPLLLSNGATATMENTFAVID